MESRLTFINFFKHPRFWRHAIPWMAILLFLYVVIFVESTGADGKPVVFDAKLLLFVVEVFVLIYASFFAYNILYKKQKRKLLFLVVVIAVILVIAGLDQLATTHVIQMGAIKGFWANLILMPLIVLVAFGLKLAYHGTKQVFVIERLQAKQTESELKLLKSQVNPHFLFNTLNNIYSTNLEDQDKANEIILELSDLLRYQLESHRKSFALLSDEINNIESYIDLEKIRVRDCKVEFLKSGDFGELKIVPLLLLPFVENAFKYGTGIGPGHIVISFSVDHAKLFHFYCKNKIVQKNGKVHSGGIGLENVKKRLELAYPNNYDLKIETDKKEFIIDLKLQL